MRRVKGWLPVLALLLLLVSCGRGADVRPAGPGTDREGPMFPDYREVTVPCNIAPLNFYYTASGRCETVFSAGDVSFTLRGREVVWKEKRWRKLVEAAREGGEIRVVTKMPGQAGHDGTGPGMAQEVRWKIYVSGDRIDP